MKLTWAKIKDYVYLATIATAVMFHFIDKAKSTTTYEVTFVIHQQDYEEFKIETKDKIREYDKLWIEDIKGDEHVTTLLELFVTGGTGSTEGN